MPQNLPLELAFCAGKKDHHDPLKSVRLPPKPNTRSNSWDPLHVSAISEPSSLPKWDKLITVLEECTKVALDRGDSLIVLKSAILDLFNGLLSIYPYLTSYWRRYVLLMGKVGKPRDVIEFLKLAVDSNPQSIVLWVDYVHALATELSRDKTNLSGEETVRIESLSHTEGKTNTKVKTNTELTKSDPLKSSSPNLQEYSLEFIRLEFRRGADLVGRNFNSEAFWDAYIDFESKQSTTSLLLLDIYLDLVTIPLYLYAHFYNKFIQAIKNYPIEEVIKDKDHLLSLIKKYGKSLADELSSDESQQIIDTFTYEIFTKTQQEVNEKWKFESEILIHEYTPSSTPALETQYNKYLQYLDHEISNLQAEKDQETDQAKDPKKNPISNLKKNIISIFERSLVPHCHKTELWQKYLAFLQLNEFSYDQILEVYERAIFKFSPIENQDIRAQYVSYMTGLAKIDSATVFLLRTLKLFVGGEKLLYLKSAYISDMKQLMYLWKTHLSESSVETCLEGLVAGFFDHVNRNKKSTKPQEEKGEKITLKESHVDSLSKILNKEGVCIATVTFLRILGNDKKNVARIRKFFNKHHHEGAFKHSVQFWRFFVDFEGVQQKNFVNLHNVVTYIKEFSTLPKRAIDSFLEIQYELTCCNLYQISSLPDSNRLLLPLITYYSETSDDFYTNAPARRRLARNNLKLESQGSSQASKEIQVLLNLKKQAGHPGVYSEAVPEITNSWISKGWISLLDDDLKTPRLPTFRYTEKANSSFTYEEN